MNTDEEVLEPGVNDLFHVPNINDIYIPPIPPLLKDFVKDVCTAFVNKVVSLKFSDDESCFDYSVFELVEKNHIRIVASSSQSQLREIVMTGVPEEIRSFNAKTVPIDLDDQQNLSSWMIRRATLVITNGKKPDVEIIAIAEDDRIHPHLQKLFTANMNFVAGVPLFVRGQPIGVLWGIRKDRLEQTQKKEITWQMQSMYEGIDNVVAQEFDRGADGYFARRIIEKLDATSQIYRRYYTKVHGQKLPVKSTVAHSYTYEKSYRLDTSFNIPTRGGFSVSLKQYLPEEENASKKILLMIPGFFCNRSLMDRLAMEMSLRHGYKIYSADIRGRSKFTIPPQGFVGNGWTVDDYIWQDFPAIIGWLSKQHPDYKIIIMGHSMGGMIAKFYCSAHEKAKSLINWDLPDPHKHIAGVISITSPSYIDLKARIPFFEVMKSFARFFGSSTLADPVYSMINMGILSPFATINLNRFFSVVNNVSNSVRMFSFNVGTSIPTVKDFIGYEQITVPEWYFFMENVFCEEAIKVIIQFARSLLNNNSFVSYDGKINYTEEQKKLDIPVFLAVGTKDTIAPPQTVEHGFDEFKSRIKHKAEYDQGHLGIVFHPETVRLIGEETHQWMQNF